MKANRRVRDLKRRNKTGIRRMVGRTFVTTSLFMRDANGKRVRNPAVFVQ